MKIMITIPREEYEIDKITVKELSDLCDLKDEEISFLKDKVEEYRKYQTLCSQVKTEISDLLTDISEK